MRDYEEKSYYEIQLDNKQLVLVFLAGVTVCVLIFVLGVMVGKGKKEAEMAAAGRTEEQVKPASKEEIKPPQEIKPTVDDQSAKPAGKNKQGSGKEEYSFYNLDKTETQPAQLTPAPKAQATTAKPAAQEAPPAATTAETKTAPAPEPAAPQAGSGSRYTIQVMATSSKKKADEQLNALRKKGYSAFLDEFPTSTGKVYKVRVGRFNDPESAKKIATRMKQDMKLDTWVAVLE